MPTSSWLFVLAGLSEYFGGKNSLGPDLIYAYDGSGRGCEGLVYLASVGRPSDIGCHLCKTGYPFISYVSSFSVLFLFPDPLFHLFC